MGYDGAWRMREASGPFNSDDPQRRLHSVCPGATITTLRLDLFGRLILILLGALVLLGTISVTLNYHLERHRPSVVSVPFPRLRLATGIIDLVVTEPPSRLLAVVRAGTGPDTVTLILPAETQLPDLR